MSGLLNLETALGSLGRTSSPPVTLGTLTLTDVEVSNALEIGGKQELVVHKLVGGDRVIQVMGPDPDPIILAGMFTGPGAQVCALQLTKMCDVGSPVRLGFPGGSLMVVIRPVTYTYQQQGAVIPFRVTVKVCRQRRRQPPPRPLHCPISYVPICERDTPEAREPILPEGARCQ